MGIRAYEIFETIIGYEIDNVLMMLIRNEIHCYFRFLSTTSYNFLV